MDYVDIRAIGRRMAAVIAFAILALALAGFFAPSSDARGYKSRLESIREKKKRIESDIRKLRDQKGDLSGELNSLDGEFLGKQSELDGVKKSLADQQAEMDRLGEDLAASQDDLTLKQDQLGARSVEIYKEGDLSYLDVILGAENFSDFIDRLFYLQVIYENDQKLIESVNDKIADVTLKQVAVNQKINEIKELKSEISTRIEEIKLMRQTKQEAIDAISKDEALYLKQVQELEDESKRIQADLRKLSQGAGGYKGKPWTGSFRKPCPGPITSGFGYRRHPIFHVTKMHTGVDIDGETGDPIHAGGDGKVIYADWRGGYGKCIIIDHGKGISTLYGHLSVISVHVGDIVSVGEVIGRMGSTGFSTGSHLHFEVRVNGEPVDPMSKL